MYFLHYRWNNVRFLAECTIRGISAPAHRLSSCSPESLTATVLSVWTGLLHYDLHNYHHHSFITTINAPQPPALTSEAAPASPADQSAPRPVEINRFPGRTEAISRPPPRSDQASSTTGEKRPGMPCCTLRVCMFVSVCVCVFLCKKQRWVAEADWPARRERQIQPEHNKHHFRFFLQSYSGSEKDADGNYTNENEIKLFTEMLYIEGIIKSQTFTP